MGYIKKFTKDIKRFRSEKRFKSNKRDVNCWLFGEWFGKRCNDNSFFFANYIACNHPEIKLFWVACENADVSLLNKSITILRYDSSENIEVFRRAGVVIMNQGYVDFSSSGYNYFRGAVTVNLWHGVAWKKIGHDKAKAHGFMHNIHTKVFDYFERAEKYISLSRRYTAVLNTAFHAESQNIIETGYPRNSLFYSSKWLDDNKTSLLDRLKRDNGIEVSDKAVIILYMPTFRDNPTDLKSLESLAEDADFLDWLEKNDIIILQKAHFVSQQRNELQTDRSCSRILEVNDIAPYEALEAADILITDYSSCFFDYLVLDRPIIHYIYDYDNYKSADRGVYYEIDDVVCGETAFNEDELRRAIIKYVKDPTADADLRNKRRGQFIEYESSDSCEILYNRLMQISSEKQA